MKASNYNISNILSILRIVSSIPLIICFDRFDEFEYKIFSIAIIIFIFISDILDGYLARKLNIVTDLGKIIDPVADKMCLIVVLIYLIDVYRTPFLIFFLILSFRDILLITLTLYLILYHGHVTQANTNGKVFIFISTIMIISYIYNAPLIFSNILYYLSILMMFISTITYLKSHISKIGEYESI